MTFLPFAVRVGLVEKENIHLLNLFVQSLLTEMVVNILKEIRYVISKAEPLTNLQQLDCFRVY
jgi:hypothetical protein